MTALSSACYNEKSPKRLGRELYKNSRGQSTVELALGLPLIAVLLMVLLQVAAIAGLKVATINTAAEVAKLIAYQEDIDYVAVLDISHELQDETLVINIEQTPIGAVGTLVQVSARRRVELPEWLGIGPRWVESKSAATRPDW